MQYIPHNIPLGSLYLQATVQLIVTNETSLVKRSM